MNPILRGAIAALGVALLGGCATAPGTAELVGERYYRATIDTYDVVVTAIDGRGAPLRGRLFVDAGRHEVVVAGPMSVVGRVEQARLTLDVKPCTRYYLVAVKPNRLASDFEVRVDHEEPMAICTPAAAG